MKTTEFLRIAVIATLFISSHCNDEVKISIVDRDSDTNKDNNLRRPRLRRATTINNVPTQSPTTYKACVPSQHEKVPSPYSYIGCGNCLDKSNHVFSSTTVTEAGVTSFDKDCIGCSNLDCIDYCSSCNGQLGGALVGVTVKHISTNRKKCLCNYSLAVPWPADPSTTYVKGSDGVSSSFCYAV